MTPNKFPLRLLAATLAAAAALTALPGCAPLLIGGAMLGGTMMYVDRRTSGTQVEDQAIELKANSPACASWRCRPMSTSPATTAWC